MKIVAKWGKVRMPRYSSVPVSGGGPSERTVFCTRISLVVSVRKFLVTVSQVELSYILILNILIRRLNRVILQVPRTGVFETSSEKEYRRCFGKRGYFTNLE